MKPAFLFSWILQLVIAGVLLMAGSAKFTGADEPVALFQQLDFDPGGRYLIGLLEVIAAVLLLVPQSVAWGAILGWGVMTGALIAHGTRLGFGGETGMMGWLAAGLWIGCAAVVFLRRHQTGFLKHMFECHETGDDPDQP